MLRFMLFFMLLILVVPLLYVVYEKTIHPKPTDWLPYGLKWKESFKKEYRENET